jgi:metal-responsive CopG/Arc/MetJ family transcriptional regulator
MVRVNIFLKDKLLNQIDQEAREEGTNRSALIQTALEKYMDAKQRERGEKEERKKMQEASRKIDALAKRLGRWNPEAIVRKFRNSNLKGDS